MLFSTHSPPDKMHSGQITIPYWHWYYFCHYIKCLCFTSYLRFQESTAKKKTQIMNCLKRPVLWGIFKDNRWCGVLNWLVFQMQEWKRKELQQFESHSVKWGWGCKTETLSLTIHIHLYYNSNVPFLVKGSDSLRIPCKCSFLTILSQTRKFCTAIWTASLQHFYNIYNII